MTGNVDSRTGKETEHDTIPDLRSVLFGFNSEDSPKNEVVLHCFRTLEELGFGLGAGRETPAIPGQSDKRYVYWTNVSVTNPWAILAVIKKDGESSSVIGITIGHRNPAWDYDQAITDNNKLFDPAYTPHISRTIEDFESKIATANVLTPATEPVYIRPKQRPGPYDPDDYRRFFDDLYRNLSG